MVQGIASKLFNAPMAVILALNTAVSYTNAPPIMNMTVKDYLWGYDEPLVRYGSKVLPSWLDFDKLGILDRVSIVLASIFSRMSINY